MTVVEQLLAMLPELERVNPTVVFEKENELGVAISLHVEELESAGTVISCPLTVMF